MRAEGTRRWVTAIALLVVVAACSNELLRTIQLQAEQSLLTDPEEFWTRVRVPVLAIFGENDLNVDSELSAARYEQYLTEAGNPDFTIEILPGVGHSITLATPGYWGLLSTWLADRFSE